MQLFPLSNGLNNPNEWHALNKRGYSKEHFLLIYHLIKSIYQHLMIKFMTVIIVPKTSIFEVVILLNIITLFCDERRNFKA